MEVSVMMGVVSNETLTAMERRRLEMSTEYFLVPTPVMSTGGVATSTFPPAVPAVEMTSLFRNEVWVVPALSLSALVMVFIAGFEVFVVCKARRTTPSRRHLFLGQMLLLGLFGCAALGTVLAVQPTPFSCGVVRFGTGVALALVFASLLVKCVFLISLNSGVYLPASYQALLLLFAVLIQVAIGSQWLATTPPTVDMVTVPISDPISANSHPRHRLVVTAEDISRSAMGTAKMTMCHFPYVHLLLSLLYVAFLIAFVTVLAVKSRRIRDNYREATYIGLSIACTIPTCMVWTISGFIVAERHRDACVAFGLCVMSAIIFLIMFMPKGRQLAAMGKDGVYVEDRDDRCSSLSRPASGYSPSFFHFKPVKFAAPPGTNATIKHPLNVATLPGDLSMYPPPPSYTRLQYHCYPSPPAYYSSRYLSGGVFLRPDDGNVYTTLEPTLSSNPNVYFQRGSGMHPGMMY